MLAIMAVHAHTSSLATLPSEPDGLAGVGSRLLARSDVALPIFFVISAALLFYRSLRAWLDGQPPEPVGQNLFRRLARIYPTWWVVGLILVVLGAVELDGSWQWLGAITLTYPFFVSPFEAGNFSGLGQTWMIVILLQLYVAMPLMERGVRAVYSKYNLSERRRRVLWLCAAIGLFGFAARALLSFGSLEWESRAIVYLPFWCDTLAVGLALGTIVAFRDTSRWTPPHGWWTILGWLGGVAIFVAFAITVRPPAQIGVIQAEFSFRHIAYATVAGLWTWAALLGSDAIASVLASKPVQLTSRLSLGFFFAHLGIMGLAEEWLGYEPFRAEPLPLMAATLPLALVVATVGWYVGDRLISPILQPILQRTDTPG